MGKATDLDDKLSAQLLTPDEIKARRAATEIGDDDVVATLDGKLVKGTSTETAQPVFRAPQQTWD